MHQPSNGRPLVLLTIALVAFVTGCISPGSALCSDGRTCPPNTRCDVGRHLCVSDAQAAACAGLAPSAACKLAGAPGFCRDGLCEPLFCGDGMRTATESCDGADLAEMTCAKLGYYAQTTGLTCGADCKFDTSGCTGACGDEMTNGPEQCDGAPPLGKTCIDYGFDRGRVGCSALCGPDLGGCGQIGWKMVLAGTFNALWGAAHDDLFAVGPKGNIVRGDGTTWSTMKSGTTEDLLRVWGSGPDDVFAVGGSSILHWNGTDWSPMRLPAGVGVLGVDLIRGDVWGSGPNDVFVVGATNLILHWDGSTWSATQPLSDTWWSGMWGSGPKDIYVVGGMIAHWDGSRWSETSGPGPDKVWGSGPSDVFACGGISCSHWDGTKWSPTSWGPGVPGQVSSIWGSGPKDVLAVLGKRLMHWDGTSWSETSSPDSPRAIWGTGPDDVFIAGVGGIHHRTGDSWFATTSPMTINYITSLWAGGPDELFVGGQGCPECTPMLVPHFETISLPNFALVVDVWGSSSSDVFAVTSDGDIYHWDGTSWSASYEGAFVRRIWGSGPEAVFALGGPRAGEGSPPNSDPSQRSHVVRWDGRRWSPMLLPVETRLLSGLWASSQGEAFAVGEAGEIVYWDGEVWSSMESGSTENLIDVWGSGRDDVFAVGARGTVLHYDGAKWSPMRSGTIPLDSSLFYVRGSGRGDVFVVGGSNEDQLLSKFGPVGDLLLHLRTGDWERISLPADVKIGALSVTPSRVFFENGTGNGTEILQLDRNGVTCEGPEKSCSDGWDNDCDGLVDRDDPDCAGMVPEQCANLFDDDGNGLVDCADPGCATFPACRHK